MSNWQLDAQLLDDLDERYIFKNARINTFLKKGDYSKFILVASKGMGKTLLLRNKRNEIENSKKGILLIPKNETADYVNLPASIGREFYSAMSDKNFWVDIWKLSISISVLLNFPLEISDSEKAYALSEIDRSILPQEISDELKQSFCDEYKSYRKPSAILDILIQSGKSNLEKTRSSAIHRLTELFNKHVSSSCMVFTDSFDQALVHNFSDNLTIWCSAQTGLMKAAWELSRHNRHVKVYTTIRQEAYASFDDSERLNIEGSAIIIEYSRDDLRGIFNKALEHYEHCNSIDTFLGFSKIYNSYLRAYEDPFDYICRHTIQVPRWLMKIGEELSIVRTEYGMIENASKRKQQQEVVADIVNHVSAESLAAHHICSEMKMFFSGYGPEPFLKHFLGFINSSVISLNSLNRISKKFIATDSWVGTDHPFCLMYNLGFIGYVGNTPSGRGKQQIFKKPYQFDWNYENILPKNKDSYYLVHPSLHHLIQNTRSRINFNKIQIGDGRTWGKKEDDRINSETIRMFISYSSDDWKIVEKAVDIIDEYLNEKSILHDIWLDKWKMKGGKWFQDQMLEGLATSDYLILVASSKSMASSAVEVEWKTKFSAKISQGEDAVFPLLTGDIKYQELPGYLANIHAYRFDNEHDKDNVIRLIDDIIFWHAEKEKIQ